MDIFLTTIRLFRKMDITAVAMYVFAGLLATVGSCVTLYICIPTCLPTRRSSRSVDNFGRQMVRSTEVYANPEASVGQSASWKHVFKSPPQQLTVVVIDAQPKPPTTYGPPPRYTSSMHDDGISV